MATPSGKSVPQQSRDGATPSILASIVATIGPASDPPETIRRLIQSGVCVFRFNFSHGDLASHERRLAAVRGVAESMGACIACLGDLQGPKIRVGVVPEGVGETRPGGGGGSIRVEAGQDVVFKKDIDRASVRGGVGGPEAVLPVTYQPLIDEVAVGHKVLINDGAIRMLAVERDARAGELRCRVTVGGLITSNKGINLPQSALSTSAITDRDWECVEWALAKGLDYLALSFVRCAEDVRLLKERLDRAWREGGAWISVVSKIEMPQAVADLARIVEASDAVMVARGDLGVEMDIAQVPVVQKRIVAACAEFGKPVIVATQMLETMIENASPTRAEATDVANAVFDGADAVMLSAETATGKHPPLVVDTMARILAEAERWQRANRAGPTTPTRLASAHRGTAALARAAWGMAHDLDARVVVCWSQNGGTARYLSQNRFDVPIVAYSSDPASCRRMAMCRGVTPVCAEPPPSTMLGEWIMAVDAFLLARGLALPGDPIILLAGRPLGKAKATNAITIHRVGEPSGFGPHIA
ncbi:MAG: pyruvate kinase [Phycisphaerales bacterium]|nr:pyruvate kinase [Phycisphaerales bacterium]